MSCDSMNLLILDGKDDDVYFGQWLLLPLKKKNPHTLSNGLAKNRPINFYQINIIRDLNQLHVIFSPSKAKFY